jgi:hypothetical protein
MPASESRLFQVSNPGETGFACPATLDIKEKAGI